jgi:cobalamin biosynthesis Mg chelatase CobN
VADGFRPRPGLDVAAAIGALAVGEALVSFLDAQGAPIPVQRAWVVPPAARVGALAEEARRDLVQASPLRPLYAEAQDRESAYELLRRRAEEGVALEEARKLEAQERKLEERAAAEAERQAERQQRAEERERERAEAQARRERDRLLLSVAGELGQALGGRSGRSIARGVLGGMLGRGR